MPLFKQKVKTKTATMAGGVLRQANDAPCAMGIAYKSFHMI